jgi:hypothetical protein
VEEERPTSIFKEEECRSIAAAVEDGEIGGGVHMHSRYYSSTGGEC